MSSGLGCQLSKPVAARSCSTVTNVVPVPVCTQALFRGFAGSQATNLEITQDPFFFKPRLLQRQNAQGSPGRKSGTLVLVVLRSKARRSRWLTLMSSKWRWASDRMISALAWRLSCSSHLPALVAKEVGSVRSPHGSLGTLPNTAWNADRPLVQVEEFTACMANGMILSSC